MAVSEQHGVHRRPRDAPDCEQARRPDRPRAGGRAGEVLRHCPKGRVDGLQRGRGHPTHPWPAMTAPDFKAMAYGHGMMHGEYGSVHLGESALYELLRDAYNRGLEDAAREALC